MSGNVSGSCVRKSTTQNQNSIEKIVEEIGCVGSLFRSAGEEKKVTMMLEEVNEDSKKNIFIRRAKPERNLWREDEILTLLKIFRDNNYVELLSDKNTKSEIVFRGMEDQMAAYGYNKKNYQQIWTKWKFLKSTYMTSRRANVIPKVITTKTYLSLDNLLSSTFSIHYQHQDSDSFYENGSRYDSETSMGSNNNSISMNNNHSLPIPETRFMEHPIFGSRLEEDYVKSEPLDIDEFHQQMQDDAEENGTENNEDDEEEEEEPQTTIPVANNQPPVEEAMSALGLMPVAQEIFSPPKTIESISSVPKTQVPRLKTVPLRKINLKQPQQPIPIAPVSNHNNHIPNPPKLLPKPSAQLTATPVSQQQKLPKLKLSIKQPIKHHASNSNSKHSEYERHSESDHEPPAKSQKIHAGSSAGQPSIKPKSMKDLANNLKDMQKDLIADFFKKQQELITEEFEFQRKQDAMMLKSFEDQNRVLLTAAKNLIEQIPSNFYL